MALVFLDVDGTLLPFGASSISPTVEDGYFGLHWKTRAVVDRAAGRPLAWLDDEITDSDREWIEDRHPAPALLLRVDPLRGLTVHDLDALEAWLAGTTPRRSRPLTS